MEGERKGEKHQLVAFCLLQAWEEGRAQNPLPRHEPGLGREQTFQFAEGHPRG